MTNLHIDLLKEAVRICRDSSMYLSLNKTWKHEAVMHAYEIILTMRMSQEKRPSEKEKASLTHYDYL